jgi:hypothetical protein
MGTTKPAVLRKATTGVRYERPLFRPRWWITARGGTAQANVFMMGFVNTRFT